MCLEKLRDKGLTHNIKEKLKNEYGERGEKALKAVEEKRVKEYLDFIVVVGNTKEYIVEENNCSCPDFYYNLDKGEFCWHILAVKIADALDSVDKHDMWYSNVEDII